MGHSLFPALIQAPCEGPGLAGRCMKVFTNKGHDLSVCETSEQAAWLCLHKARPGLCLTASTFPNGFNPQQAGRWHGLNDGFAALPSGHCGCNQPVLGKDGLPGLGRAGGGTVLLPETETR